MSDNRSDSDKGMFKISSHLAARLLRVIFGCYFVITVIVTTSQLISEYNHVKSSLHEEIKKFSSTFGPGLASALWTFSETGIENITFGMKRSASMLGVKVLNERGHLERAIGIVEDEKKRIILYDDQGKIAKENYNEVDSYGLFSYEFPIYYEDGDKKHLVGYGTIYSGSSVVVQRIQYGFFLIIINSIIKTLALWFIFLFFIQKIVGKPLVEISSVISKLDWRSKEKLEERIRDFDKLPLRDDELGNLVETFKKMALSIEAKIEQIEEQNASLEAKVVERTKELQSKTNDIVAIFQHIPFGIFMILENTKIHPEYSNSLLNIFEIDNINDDTKFEDLLFSNSALTNDQIAQCSSAIRSGIGEDIISFELNCHLVIKEYVKFVNGKNKILAIDWQPVVNNDIVDKLLVTIKDVTDIRNLEEKTQQQRKELEIIGQILDSGLDSFERFDASARQLIDESKLILQSRDPEDGTVIPTVFRNIHTIKGNARIYNYSFISESAHQLENKFSSLTNINRKVLINEITEDIAQVLKEYNSTYLKKLKQLKGSDKIQLESKIYAILREFIVSLNDKNGMEIIMATETISLSSILNDIAKSLQNIAQRIQKPEPLSIIESGKNIRISTNLFSSIQSVMTHIFRNAIDHGIELAYERVKMGKPRQGKIYVSASLDKKAGIVNISIEDDGKGLDIAKIKQRAVAKNIIDQYEDDPLKIARCIFETGISTSESITEISGRGVGCDAVKNIIEEIGGKIEIEPINMNKGFLIFRYLISFPDEYAIDPSDNLYLRKLESNTYRYVANNSI